jgi:hypothetical protein
LEKIEWNFACNFGFIWANAMKLLRVEIFDHLHEKDKFSNFFLFSDFLIKSYFFEEVGKVEVWLPKEYTIFATYFVGTYNKMQLLVADGPIQNTVIVQVII